MIDLYGYKVTNEFYKLIKELMWENDIKDFLENDDICFKKIEKDGFEFIILKEDDTLEVMKRSR